MRICTNETCGWACVCLTDYRVVFIVTDGRVVSVTDGRVVFIVTDDRVVTDSDR